MLNIREGNKKTVNMKDNIPSQNEEFSFRKTMEQILPIESLKTYSQDKIAEYIKANQIDEIFQILCTSVLYFKPEDVKEFLIKELKRIKDNGLEYNLENIEESDRDDIKIR